MANGRADLSELPDGCLNLVVEDPAVCNDDDRVENLFAGIPHANQLVTEPGN